jgi:preprotein translocase subunit SecD
MVAASSTTLLAEPTLEEAYHFYLCEAFVEEAAITRSANWPDRWFLDIQLTPMGSSSLENFTHSHIGKITQFMVASSLIVEAHIRATIDSGRIRSAPHTKSSAKALAEILASPPPSPCGFKSPAA